MPSKKKSKPSYDVPEDLQSAPQAGWVYRSDAPKSPKTKAPGTHRPAAKTAPIATPASTPAAMPSAPPPAPAPPPVTVAIAERPQGSRETDSQADSVKSDDGIMDLAVRTISSSFKVLGDVMLLTTRIITAPVSMGLKMLGLK